MYVDIDLYQWKWKKYLFKMLLGSSRKNFIPFCSSVLRTSLMPSAWWRSIVRLSPSNMIGNALAFLWRTTKSSGFLSFLLFRPTFLLSMINPQDPTTTCHRLEVTNRPLESTEGPPIQKLGVHRFCQPVQKNTTKNLAGIWRVKTRRGESKLPAPRIQSTKSFGYLTIDNTSDGSDLDDLSLSQL